MIIKKFAALYKFLLLSVIDMNCYLPKLIDFMLPFLFKLIHHSGIKYIFLFVVSFYTVILAHSTMQCMYDVYKRIFTYLYFDFRFIFIDQLYCKCLIHICWISKEYLNQDSKSWYCHRIRMMHLGNLLYHLIAVCNEYIPACFFNFAPPPLAVKKWPDFTW